MARATSAPTARRRRAPACRSRSSTAAPTRRTRSSRDARTRRSSTTRRVFGREEYHGTIVASVAAAPENGVGIVGVYPAAALQLYDASSDPRGISDDSAIDGHPRRGAALPRRDQPQLRQHAARPAARRTRSSPRCTTAASSSRPPGNSGELGQPADVPRRRGRTCSRSARPTRTTRSRRSRPSARRRRRRARRRHHRRRAALARPDRLPATGSPARASPSPIVAAAAAWIWTLRPTLTVDAARRRPARRARATSARPASTPASGWGIVDIPAALAAPTPAQRSGGAERRRRPGEAGQALRRRGSRR